MMPLMQVKLRLLGKCAQCLLTKEECGHLDRTCGDRVSQCNQMGPLSREEWRKRIGKVSYDKLCGSDRPQGCHCTMAAPPRAKAGVGCCLAAWPAC